MVKEKLTSPRFPNWNVAGFIASGGVLLLIAGGIAYISNELWHVYAEIGMGVGLATLLVTAMLHPNAIRTFLTGQPTKYASNVMIKSVAFLGLLVLINILGIRYVWEVDLTSTGQLFHPEDAGPSMPQELWLNSLQMGIIISSTLIIIPLAVLATGIRIWWKRR